MHIRVQRPDLEVPDLEVPDLEVPDLVPDVEVVAGAVSCSWQFLLRLTHNRLRASPAQSFLRLTNRLSLDEITRCAASSLISLPLIGFYKRVILAVDIEIIDTSHSTLTTILRTKGPASYSRRLKAFCATGSP